MSFFRGRSPEEQTEVTACDSNSDRIERLRETLGYLKALVPDFDEAHLAEMHDHKGMLMLTWRRPPTSWTQACCARAWEVQGELGENVEHRMHGETDYAERIDIELSWPSSP